MTKPLLYKIYRVLHTYTMGQVLAQQTGTMGQVPAQQTGTHRSEMAHYSHHRRKNETENLEIGCRKFEPHVFVDGSKVTSKVTRTGNVHERTETNSVVLSQHRDA